MKNSIKDVLHHYIGIKATSNIQIELAPETYAEAGSQFFVTHGFLNIVSSKDIYEAFTYYMRDIESLTDDEVCKMFNLIKSEATVKVARKRIEQGSFTPEQFNYMTKLGIDLFELIESGQVKKIEPEEPNPSNN